MNCEKKKGNRVSEEREEGAEQATIYMTVPFSLLAVGTKLGHERL